MPSIEDAIALAAQAHAGQQDKNGQPYILHPLRVMLAMAPDDTEGQIVAVLHDVLEDTAITDDDLLKQGYPLHIVTALRALTHRPGEPYMDYVHRACRFQLSRQVKLADLRDNFGRLSSITDEATRDRLRAKYSPALKYLTTFIAD